MSGLGGCAETRFGVTSDECLPVSTLLTEGTVKGSFVRTSLGSVKPLPQNKNQSQDWSRLQEVDPV